MLRSLSVLSLLVLISAFTVAKDADRKSSVAKPAQQKQSLPSRGSITGRIICEDGQMPAHLRVTLWTQKDRGGVPRQVVVDEAGRFQVDDLPPAAYTISAFAPGYITDIPVGRQRYYRVGDSVTFKIRKGGVITGTLTDTNGEPVSAVQVRAFRIRDHEGRPIRGGAGWASTLTDDRGVYRIYGLHPGTYLVVAAPLFKSSSSETDVPASTYYPSATRDRAAEVVVQAGEESSNIDIRYRSERGHTISGVLQGAVVQGGGPRTWVSITHAGSGVVESTAFVLGGNDNTFAVHGVPNGEYLVAARSQENEEESASPPVRAIVKGADVSGLELKLAPLGSIRGQIILERAQPAEQAPGCKENRGATLEESVITIRRHLAKNEKPNMLASSLDVSPNERGEFRLSGLESSRYRFELRQPTETWYVRAITLPAANGKPRDVSLDGISIKQGDKVSNITIKVSEGAASIQGKVVAAEDASLPSRLRVHLIPAERRYIEDILRYAEVEVESGSTFTLTGLAPGKYLVLARPAIEDESGTELPWPAAWEGEMRKRLRAEAESSGVTIDLKPCQRAVDLLLQYAQPATARPTSRGL